VQPEHIERIAGRLAQVGLLDDLAFARFWIENRESFRPRGATAIRYELRAKGVNETIIAHALASAGLDEVASAYRVAQKILPRLGAIEERWEFQQKLAAYLGRRGFGWDTIREVSEQVWQERSGDR
jgi:regulatory protein